MASDYYDKLSDLKLLRRAWHLARKDSRHDFMFDPYRFSDFAFQMDDHLNEIARSLRSGTYHPKPLLKIDIPKSSLSVRPGTVLSIEDKIILFAISLQIAPILDKQLPDTVYSWRVKKGKNKKELFAANNILKFPFLKRTTIQRQVDFVESWYDVWPKFTKELKIAYEEDGYCLMVVSDIAAYFENIDIALLRDLLLHYLTKQPRIINFLIMLLEFWSWPTVYGGRSAQGIPQGNGVSSFLGNIYLLPLDLAFEKICKSRDIKYFRYMDDVKVMTKDVNVAREALFLMNEKLRELRLNIQGAKTRILKGNEIRDDLFDDRLDNVNKVIEDIQETKSLSTAKREDFTKLLKRERNKIKGRKNIIRDKELRLFRRIITGFTLLERDSGMVSLVLDQIERNPDAKLLNSAVRYLRVQDRNIKEIPKRLFRSLALGKLIFPHQNAHFLMTLRYQRDLSDEVWREAKKRLRARREHWYVRQQAAQLIGLKSLSTSELKSLKKTFWEEPNNEVRRALAQPLAQLPEQDLREFSKGLLFDPEPKIQRLGRYYSGLLSDTNRARVCMKTLFQNFLDKVLVDRLYEVEILSKSEEPMIRSKLLENLKKGRSNLRKPMIKERIKSIVKTLQQTAGQP